MKEMKLTIPVILANDVDIIQTLSLFTSIKQDFSVACFNEGKKPLNAVQLQKQVYQAIKGKVSSQLTITAMRCVAGAYASAWKQRKSRELKKAFFFKKEAAVYLIGQRGRDADFRKDGTLSIWTHVGRKHITYTIPEHYKTIFNSAKEYDSMTVIERDGQLIGKLCCTIEVPESGLQSK